MVLARIFRVQDTLPCSLDDHQLSGDGYPAYPPAADNSAIFLQVDLATPGGHKPRSRAYAPLNRASSSRTWR